MEVVEFTMTLAGDPEDLNQTLYKSVLASLLPLVEPEDVQLTVTAGSIIVRAFITTSLPDDVVYILSQLNAAEFLHLLGLGVESLQLPKIVLLPVSISPKPPPVSLS